MKKKAADFSSPILEEESVNWNSKKVFTEIGGEIYLGGEKIRPDIKALLRDQAIYLESSQLFEIISNTAKQEAINMALKDSKEWNHVLSAKMLWHWNHVFEKMIKTLRS